MPEEVEEAIKSPDVIKWSFNANFERICLSKYLPYLGLSQNCSITLWFGPHILVCLYHGELGAVLGLDKQKYSEGRILFVIFVFLITSKQMEDAHEICQFMIWKSGRCSNSTISVMWKLKWLYKRNSISFSGTRFYLGWAYHLDPEINDRGIGIDLGL